MPLEPWMGSMWPLDVPGEVEAFITTTGAFIPSSSWPLWMMTTSSSGWMWVQRFKLRGTDLQALRAEAEARG